MRKLIIIIMTVTILFMNVITAQAIITDVSILPENPTDIDLISILVSGEESGDIYVDSSYFQIDGLSLSLDIYLESGFLPVVTPWSHSESIGALSVGIYDLTVNTLIDSNPVYDDTFNTSFEVVPEPVTVLLLGSGICLLRSRNYEN